MQKSKLQINPEAIHSNSSGCYGARIQICFLIIGMLFLPYLVSASSVYVDSKNSEFFVGDNIVLNVRIDSEGKNINTAEGNILLESIPEIFSIKDINVAESSFSLWLHKPSLSSNEKSIYFAGGVPRGLKSQDAILFKIVLNLQKTGRIIIKPENLSVYLNDGKGTKDAVNSNPFSINISAAPEGYNPIDEWAIINKNDHTSPEKFEIYLGQEGSVFEGKKFLSFNAVDNQSGIKYYEVQEGDLAPVRSGNTYVLQEQNKPVKVVVTAYDAAGNARESVYESKAFDLNLVVIVVFVALILIAILMIIRLKLKNQRSK